jgi:hypothetical protein
MKKYSIKIEIVPSSRITKVILNDKEMTSDELRPVMLALSDRDILIQKSGYIFNSSILDNCLCFGVLPYFIEGERTHHFDIDLPVKGKCVLYGFINSNQTLAILFKPNNDTYNNGFLPGIADIFRDNYIRFARVLVNNGFSENVELDQATINILEEIKLFTEPPSTIKELAQQNTTLDFDKRVS